MPPGPVRFVRVDLFAGATAAAFGSLLVELTLEFSLPGHVQRVAGAPGDKVGVARAHGLLIVFVTSPERRWSPEQQTTLLEGRSDFHPPDIPSHSGGAFAFAPSLAKPSRRPP